MNRRSLKSYFKSSLVQLGIYERTKASWIYDFIGLWLIGE